MLGHIHIWYTDGLHTELRRSHRKIPHTRTKKHEKLAELTLVPGNQFKRGASSVSPRDTCPLLLESRSPLGPGKPLCQSLCSLGSSLGSTSGRDSPPSSPPASPSPTSRNLHASQILTSATAFCASVSSTYTPKRSLAVITQQQASGTGAGAEINPGDRKVKSDRD